MDATVTPLLNGEKRRSRTEIIATILMLAQKGETRPRIAKKARLNSKQLRLYLRKMAKAELLNIKKEDGTAVYVTSEKGIQFSEQFKALKDLSRKDKPTPHAIAE